MKKKFISRHIELKWLYNSVFQKVITYHKFTEGEVKNITGQSFNVIPGFTGAPGILIYF